MGFSSAVIDIFLRSPGHFFIMLVYLKKFWSFAVQTATYLINHTPSSVHSATSPFEVLFRRKPNYRKLRIFGCICFLWLRPYQLGKLSFPSKLCIFIGYSTNQSAYRCYDLETGRIFVSRHVKFSETTFWNFAKLILAESDPFP